MAKSRIDVIVLQAAIIIAGLAAITALSSVLERNRPQLATEYSDTDLNVLGSRMKGFSFGMEGLIADWYYMRSLQYIGGKMLASKDVSVDLDNLRPLNPRLLYPMLDNATDLDPNFLEAHHYGAVILPTIDPEQAIALTQKGIAKNPDSWRLYQDLGYIYWRLGQYEKAADAYEAGAKIPGAAPFIPLMAGAMRTEGGSRLTARRVFEQMLIGTDDPAVRLTAERRLADLDSLDERDALDAALAEAKARTGTCPGNFSEIFASLAKVQGPGRRSFRIDRSNRIVDPTNEPYAIDNENCRSTLAGGGTKLIWK